MNNDNTPEERAELVTGYYEELLNKPEPTIIEMALKNTHVKIIHEIKKVSDNDYRKIERIVELFSKSKEPSTINKDIEQYQSLSDAFALSEMALEELLDGNEYIALDRDQVANQIFGSYSGYNLKEKLAIIELNKYTKAPHEKQKQTNDYWSPYRKKFNNYINEGKTQSIAINEIRKLIIKDCSWPKKKPIKGSFPNRATLFRQLVSKRE